MKSIFKKKQFMKKNNLIWQNKYTNIQCITEMSILLG